MPSIVDHMRVGKMHDRRIRLSDTDREDIRKLYVDGMSIHSMSRTYGVSRRLIQFILRPESHERNLELRRLRGGTAIYYNAEHNRRSIAEHRSYKKKLLLEGKIS